MFIKVGEGVTGWVAEKGEPFLVPDVSQEPRFIHTVVPTPSQSELAVPLKTKEGVIGVLNVESDRLDAFDDSDLAVLQSLANQAAVAIENARLFEVEERRAEQFHVISKVGRHITSILDENDLLQEIVRLLKETFGYYLITIGLIEGDEVVFRAGAKTHWDDPQFRPPPTKVDGEGITAWVAATGEPLLAPDVSQEPRFLFLPDAAETRSELAVPLKLALSSAEGTKTEVLGVLNVESDQLNAFDESDLVVLQSLAHQAAIAIENARLFRNTARQVRELRALAEASRIISSVLDQEQILESFYEQITRIAPTDFYLIALYDEATNVVSIEINVDEGVRYPKQQYVLDSGLLKLVIHNKQPLRFDSLVEERHKLDTEIVHVGSPKLNHGWLGVPMLYGDKVVGALVVGSYQRGAFDEGHQQTLTSIANQAAVALENARLFAERERRLDEMAVLNEVGRAISSTLQLDELLDLIYYQVSRVMDATNLYIALYDKDEDWVSFPLYVEGGRVRRHSQGRKAGQGLTEYLIRSCQPLLLPDNVDGRMRELGIEVIGKPAKSWLGVPMIAGDEVLGVIAVQSYTTENVYDKGHLNLLPTIAAQAAIAIENAHLYEQAQQLAVVEERQRLARELHDAVTQTLFSASLIAEAVPPLWETDQDEGRQLLQDLRQLTRGALAEMRTLLMELRPAALVEANLPDLVRQLGESVTGRTGVPVSVSVDGDVAPPDEVHVALYRITQEALNNIVKHAQASQVVVSLQCTPRGVNLEVNDNGRGFDTSDIEPGELGLGIMHERAKAIGASLNIESQLGHGTQIRAVWERMDDQ
jgi:GAF domain-containing protein